MGTYPFFHNDLNFMAFNTVRSRCLGRGEAALNVAPRALTTKPAPNLCLMKAEHTWPLMPGPCCQALKSTGPSLSIKYFCLWRAFPGKRHGEAKAGSRECLHCSQYGALPENAASWCSALDRPAGKGKAALLCTLLCWWEKPRFKL